MHAHLRNTVYGITVCTVLNLRKSFFVESEQDDALSGGGELSSTDRDRGLIKG